MAADSRIRVAFVIDTIQERTGGTENQLAYLLEHLDRSRFDPRLYVLESSEWLRETDLGVEWSSLDLQVSARPGLLSGILDFSRRLRREGIDVVQTYFRDANIVGILAARWGGVPSIISSRRGVPLWSTSLGLLFLRWLNRSVDVFVANSEATRTHYLRRERMDPDRTITIYNGLESSAFRGLSNEARSELRRSLDLPLEAPVVGIVANLRAVKGIGDFLHAAAQLRLRHPEAHFVVVGRGPEEEHLRQLGSELGLDEVLHLLGMRTDVPELLQIFDAGVLSSHFESFSNSIMEYVAAGLPVVATDVGGVREILHDGVDGFVVPPRNPAAMAARLDEVLSHPGGARAWPHVPEDARRFEVAEMVGAYEELYLRLAGERAKGET